MVFNTQREAISALTKVAASDLIKIRASGLENDGIYRTEDRIYKVSSSKKELLVANKLIGKKFKNVVTVYGAYECDILSSNGNVWKSYIIEEERLFRNKKQFVFDNLDINSIGIDINRRVPFFVSVLNGVIELASLGIFHKDLHCLNVMLDKCGTPKIIDFGIVTIKKKFDDINLSVNINYENN
jgi:serine/threonine protein kinase